MAEHITLYAGPLDGQREYRAIDPRDPDTLTIHHTVPLPSWAPADSVMPVETYVYVRKAGSTFQYSHTKR